jgi:predicted RNA-binding protein
VGNYLEVNEMCEFNVILNDQVVFKDVIYVKVDRDKVVVRDILGDLKVFEDSKIIEVNVKTARLVLASKKGLS